MSDPNPTQTRSKRSLSPSASSPPRDRTRFASYSDAPLSNTPEPSPIDAPAVPEKMLALRLDQKDSLLKTLFDLHLTSRASIAAILPSIDSDPSLANIITKSVYFGEHVIRCHRELLGDDWSPRLEKRDMGICERAADVLLSTMDYMIVDMKDFLGYNFRHMDSDHTAGMYRMDAAIALLEINCIMLERQRRSAIYARLPGYRPTGRTHRGQVNCSADACFERLAEIWGTWTTPDEEYECSLNSWETYITGSMDEDEQDEMASWLQEWRELDAAVQCAVGDNEYLATQYAICDNELHPFREAVLKYIDLPPIPPNMRYNDIPPVLPCEGEHDTLVVEHWLGTYLDKIGRILRSGKMPEREPEDSLDMGGMSIT